MFLSEPAPIVVTFGASARRRKMRDHSDEHIVDRVPWLETRFARFERNERTKLFAIEVIVAFPIRPGGMSY